jgi:hypothetical protein
MPLNIERVVDGRMDRIEALSRFASFVRVVELSPSFRVSIATLSPSTETRSSVPPPSAIRKVSSLSGRPQWPPSPALFVSASRRGAMAGRRPRLFTRRTNSRHGTRAARGCPTIPAPMTPPRPPTSRRRRWLRECSTANVTRRAGEGPPHARGETACNVPPRKRLMTRDVIWQCHPPRNISRRSASFM